MSGTNLSIDNKGGAVKAREKIKCLLCSITSVRKNLKRHLNLVHSNFLSFRSKFENISAFQALKKTDEEINLGSINDDLMNSFQDKIKKKNISFYFPKITKECNSTQSEKQANINSDDDNHNVSNNAGVSDDPSIIFSDDVDVPLAEEDFVTNNFSSNSSGTNAASTKVRQLTINVNCKACDTIETQFESVQNVLKQICQTTIDKFCLCTDKNNCCCKDTFSSLFNDFNEKKANQEKEKTVKSSDILSNFFSEATDNEKKKYFCKLCYKYASKKSSTHSSKSDWVYWGYSRELTWEFKDLMKKHLKSKQHLKSIELHEKEIKTKDSSYVEK